MADEENQQVKDAQDEPPAQEQNDNENVEDAQGDGAADAAEQPAVDEENKETEPTENVEETPPQETETAEPEQTETAEGGEEQKETVEGGEEQKETGEGGEEQKEKVEGAEEQKETGEGGEEQKEKVEGAEEQKETVEGEEQKETVEGEGEQKETTEGEAGPKENEEGEGEKKEPVEGEGEQKETVEGEGEQKETIEGEGEQKETAEEGAEQTETVGEGETKEDENADGGDVKETEQNQETTDGVKEETDENKDSEEKPEEGEDKEAAAAEETEKVEEDGEGEKKEEEATDEAKEEEQPAETAQADGEDEPAKEDDGAEKQEAEAAPEEPAAKDEDVKEAAKETEEAGEKVEEPADQKEEAAADEPKAEEEPAPKAEAATGTVGAETEDTGEKHETDPHAVSPPPKLLVDATATVKFVLMPSGQVTTLACALGQTIGDLKRHFSVELKMPGSMLVLMYDGKAMSDETTLADLGVVPNATVQLEMTSADPVNTPLKPMKPKPEYVMPDVITVRVRRDDDTIEDVVVEIERARRRKPYLGGYKHRVTGKEYHHAGAQTRPKMKPDNGIEKFCRDTQTVDEKHQRQQTMIDTSTQMTGIRVYVSNMTDKLLVPGRYTTADEHHAMIIKNVIILQSYFRRWKAKRVVENLKKDLASRMEWEREEEIRKIKEKEDRIKKEFERRMNPKSKEDFDLLYHALEKWRQEELEVIDSTMTGAQRKAALCHLLDQETQLIAAIGRHKIEAGTENKQKRIQRFLDKCAAPKKWKSYDGKYTEMDTPYTIRARELKDIHSSINMKYLTQDERLDVLLTLKHTVKEHDCKLTQDIIELIDREADLLMRGVRESNLEGLRKRISTLFLQYIKTPTFNAEAARLLKVPQDPSTLRKNIYFCPSCNQYLPSTEFSLSSNARVVGKCRQCAKLDNDGRIRQDYSHYRLLLKNLRKAEEGFGDDSRIAFLLQEVDMRYLVENIWGSQSALSAWDDLYDLVLVRWDKGEEWSPWNCILLTKDEADAHLKLDEVEESYGRVFCHKIRSKHTLARNYFSKLPGMAEHMRKRSSKPKAGHSLGSRAVILQSSKA
ncbi:IQ motif and ubiquitin-like domain-containing protein [Glandiceps talaboti]